MYFRNVVDVMTTCKSSFVNDFDLRSVANAVRNSFRIRIGLDGEAN